MDKRTVLVLGSDYGTIDIVNEAHDMGLYVLAADLMEKSPTKEAADESFLISTNAIDELEKLCRDRNVTGVLAGASDFNVEQTRNLCKRLGLPVYCSDDRAWAISRNKRMFKDLCKEVGAPVAQDYYLNDSLEEETLSSITYPVVVKPVDKSGNRGMSYCANEAELRGAWQKARSTSDNPTIIVERELHGPEWTINYLLADGKAQLFFMGAEHNQPGELENLYSLMISSSEHLKQYLDEVNDKVIEVFHKAGCTEGTAWVEAIWDDDGHFYLLEMGYRLAGECMNRPYQYVTGFNSIKWMVECALGVKHTKDDLPKPLTTAESKLAATYFLFATHDGVIGNIIGMDKVLSLPNVTLDMPKREGGAVRYHASMGEIHIVGDNCDEICKTIKKINETLVIKDVNGEDMFIYFDDYKTLKDEYENGLKEFNL